MTSVTCHPFIAVRPRKIREEPREKKSLIAIHEELVNDPRQQVNSGSSIPLQQIEHLPIELMPLVLLVLNILALAVENAE